MAHYKYSGFLTANNDQLFDMLYSPGNQVPHSGLYRCHGCGKEIAANKLDPFPPQNHHQHGYSQGNIQWRLIVATQ